MSSIPLVPVPTPAARPWLSRTLRRDLQQAAAASAGNGIVALQTRADAVVTYPLLAFLKAAGIPWFAEDPNGEVRDALAATAATQFSDTAAASDAAAANDAAAASSAPPVSPAVVIRGSVLHAASGELILGAFTSGMLAAAGCTPEYQGPAEPLQQRWNEAALTAWLRETMPLGIALLSGQGFAGIVTAYRTETGVVEAFDVLMSASPSSTLPDPAALEAAAVEANAQELTVELHFGASGLSIPAGGDAMRVPQLLVLGPSLHRGVPEAVELDAAGAASALRGHAPFQHLAVRYPTASTWDGGKARRTQELILGAAQGKAQGNPQGR
ncbi:DUF6177 family protein [Arthrobacter sp. ISL-95]|uniref:DUF6177 family protein n=1 Tax=Arthrobacter sp. ISL-95 TaxID=2819116 RepID=UPI001BE5344C|nr:DUF6177 family protein [Arthrobacter sp. ISL-95]MBT2587614.1 hypothetical protein [Arthrobacter sp. ISL-95]